VACSSIQEDGMALEHLLEVGEGIPAPEKIRRAANLQDVRAEHARSLADPDGFWSEQAKRFRWSQPWTRVLEWRVLGDVALRAGTTVPSSASTRTVPSGASPMAS
jgi:acetyl-CoA synthetase